MSTYRERIKRDCQLMEKHGLDIIILTNPANMFYLTGDDRLCAYVIITSDGKVAIGVSLTDTKDVQARAALDYIIDFEDEVGMIHSFAHNCERFGIQEGTVGLWSTLFYPNPEWEC